MDELEKTNVKEEPEVPESDISVQVEEATPIGTAPKKPKKKLTKKKIVLISVASVLAVVLIAVSGVLIWLFAGSGSSVILGDAEFKVQMANEYSIGLTNYEGDGTGKTYSLDAWFGDGKTYQVTDNDGVVSISGNILTVIKTGTFKLTVNGTVKNVTVYDAVNVTTFPQFVKAIREQKAIVLQSNITFDRTTLTAPEEGVDLVVKNDIFGNGYCMYTQGFTGTTNNYFTSLLIVKGTNIVIRDLQVFGKTPTKEMDLLQMDMYGILFCVDSDSGMRTSVSFINCILENANRLILANNADVLVKGCILNNAADACISIENNNDGPTDVTIENCVLANSAVTAINSWGYAATSDANFATITLVGFVDIYNWRDTKQTQIVPRAQGGYQAANKVINTELNSGNYNDMFYAYKGNNYMHFGILVMATGSSSVNKTEIIDYTALGFKKQEMPMNAAAKMFVKMCHIYGFDVEGDPSIKPGVSLVESDKLYEELRNGRVA